MKMTHFLYYSLDSFQQGKVCVKQQVCFTVTRLISLNSQNSSTKDADTLNGL